MASKDSSIISRWLDVFIPDELTPDRNYDLYIRAQFTLFLCLAGLLTNLIPIYLEGQQFGWTSPISMANYALGIGAATSVVLVWRYSLVSLAATLFVATAIGAMLVTCYYSGGINAAVIVWLGLAPLATAMLANVIGTITVTVIIFLGVGLLAFLQTWGGGLPEPDPAVLAPIAKSVHILSAIVCAGFLGVVHIRILRRSKKKN